MVSMSPRSPMDTYGGTPRSGYHRTLTPTPSMDRRGPSPSPLQHRVVAERKWVLGVQVYFFHSNVDGSPSSSEWLDSNPCPLIELLVLLQLPVTF